MATPVEASIWATLVPVIVGGAIGFAGAFLGPWFLESRKQETEKRKKRADKFEELIAASTNITIGSIRPAVFGFLAAKKN